MGIAVLVLPLLLSFSFAETSCDLLMGFKKAMPDSVQVEARDLVFKRKISAKSHDGSEAGDLYVYRYQGTEVIGKVYLDLQTTSEDQRIDAAVRKLSLSLSILQRLNASGQGVPVLGYALVDQKLILLMQRIDIGMETKYWPKSMSGRRSGKASLALRYNGIKQSALDDIRQTGELLKQMGVVWAEDMQFLISQNGERAFLIDVDYFSFDRQDYSWRVGLRHRDYDPVKEAERLARRIIENWKPVWRKGEALK